MLESRRRQYLEAMGISTWALRERARPAAGEVIIEATPAAEPAVAEFSAQQPLPEAPSAVHAVADEPPARQPLAEETAAAQAAVSQPAAGTVKLGPGREGILLVCASDDEPASRLANDITRALGSVPVWAWPGEGAGTVSIGRAVEDNLFTEVAVFGASLAASLFPGEAPAKVGAARLVLLPSLAEVAAQAGARQALWATLCRAGMVKPER